MLWTFPKYFGKILKFLQKKWILRENVNVLFSFDEILFIFGIFSPKKYKLS